MAVLDFGAKGSYPHPFAVASYVSTVRFTVAFGQARAAVLPFAAGWLARAAWRANGCASL
ncbi:hypothetical protein ABZ705_32500 [Streptomyces sp. NPDC006984]|uniref:hypothetical protein n=1 Tax=Streptomyces sp. NPDC006984 TaxID=3155463 RepID=UPI0033F49F1C